MSVRTAIAADLRRACVLALFGCGLLAPVEYAATLVAYPLHVPAGAALRLPLLIVTLLALVWVIAAALLGAAAVAARLLLAGVGTERATDWRGLFAIGPRDRARVTPFVPWLIAGILAALMYVAASTFLTQDFTLRFKEPVLRALVLALLQLLLFAVFALIAWASGIGLRAAGRALQPTLGELNPLGRVVPAVALLAVLAIPAIMVFLRLVPQARHQVPWRHLLALATFVAGAYLGALFLAWRGRLLPESRRRRRLWLAGSIAGTLALSALVLLRVGGEHTTKSMAVTSSPTLSRLVDLVRWLNDFDHDGFGSLLGENDCGPFDASIHVGAPDKPDDGIDQNCDGRDFSLSRLPSYKKGERMVVPDSWKRDWNFLLITIDATRRDHTTMGGYGRNTTPNLDELAKQSTWFDFCNAPSAGTMASVPAILTSKFFHSGLALDEDVKKGMPPRLRPSNTLLSEVLKEHGYTTGAIVSHEYFNDWGMEQGFDSFDNDIGREHNPRAVTSHDVTDRAIAWVGARGPSEKWFLWLHYIDPHGDYVEHPGETSFGDTDMDTYDGEIAYTDKHIGRLLREIGRSQAANRTVIAITSDHGDAFDDHPGHPRAHGDSLYFELLRVPLIVHIPELPPRTVQGAVSNIDIFPTFCDLAGADTTGLGLEGESLIPQLLYQRDASERVVFAETNWPKRQRAAITDRYKLIFRLEDNLYELYDLKADPKEKNKITSDSHPGFVEMKGYLDDWMERVFYSRDAESNQAAKALEDVLLTAPPRPAHPTEDVSFDDGRIVVLGWDADRDRYAPGDKLNLALYLEAGQRPSGAFKLQIEAWLEGAAAPGPGPRPEAKSQLRITAKGMFPTSRWRDGEFVRDRFSISLPRTWKEGDRIRFGLRMAAPDGKPVPFKGTARKESPDLAVIGEVGYTPPAGGSSPPLGP
ncbi:MAG TPA: sulfatase-like hydrolase/transferase [Kofleriaceae bacterium]|nr:sulfatase-like hydrolase/transferase [Kofleriaceae bacterium]